MFEFKRDEIGKSVDIARMKCPTCKTPADAVTGVGNKQKDGPSDGDMTVCAYCGELLLFCNNVTAVRPVTKTEVDHRLVKNKAKMDFVFDAIKVFTSADNHLRERATIKGATGFDWPTLYAALGK